MTKKKDSRTPKDEDDDLFLVDLLLDSSLSLAEIAREIGLSINELNKKINSLGLSWIKEQKKKSSRGQSALTSVMKKLLPGEKIVNEHHIGERLRLDVYCPSYRLAAEFHGRQHFFYTERFFDSKYEFEEAIKRDEKKAALCKEQGIALVVFRYNDLLTEESVYHRLLEALRSNGWSPKQSKNKKSITSDPFYIKQQELRRQKSKEMYRAIKEKKKKDE
jgi:very-short-patch-repair endonuclease